MFYRIVVATDFSDCAKEAWELATRIAEESVLSAVEDWVGKARATGLNVRPALRTGVPHEEIVTLAQDERADLIVIGTHGRGGISRTLLGSVADRVVRFAPCPVLTVREPA